MKKKCKLRDFLMRNDLAKILLMMKFTVLFLLIFVVQLSASVYSQQTKLKVNFNQASIKEVIEEIEKQTDLTFFFSGNVLNIDQTVTLNGKSISLDNILVQVSNQTGLSLVVVRDQILVKNDSSPNNILVQQSIAISGKVTDSSSDPIPGVTIIVKGTTQGTITNSDGSYSFSNVPANATLVFSFVGMRTQEIPVAGKTSIDVIMQEETIGIEEVVAIGYGTMKKSDLTGAVTRAEIEIFEESPNYNILQSLSGSVAGLKIGQTITTGEEPTIEIRGQSTLHGNKNPLIIVDGIVFRGALSNLNPSDIKSVDVLKDASSKAIYGAQATNGVILITTKIGVKHKPEFNYSTYYSYQVPAKKLRTLNREEWLQGGKDFLWQQAYLAPDYTQANPDFDLQDYAIWDERVIEGYENGTDYDWVDNTTSAGFVYSNNISVTGGTEKVSYLTSVGYDKQEGWVLNDKYSRVTSRINFDYRINDWLTVGTRTFGTFADYSGVTPPFGWGVATMSPLLTPYDANGEYELHPDGSSTDNPFLAPSPTIKIFVII